MTEKDREALRGCPYVFLVFGGVPRGIFFSSVYVFRGALRRYPPQI